MPATTFSKLWDRLLSQGVVSITASELSGRANASAEATFRAVHDAKAAGLLFSPAKGLYVLVPPQYRSWGTVPADWYVDDMMRHMGRRYYVSFLTAAARHGASHQASQLFQVVVDAKTRDRDIGGVRLRFYRSAAIDNRPTEEVMASTGRLTVATPETCLLDLAERPAVGGGLNVILEVVPDLQIKSDALVAAASERPRAVVRRCGWIVSRTHPSLKLAELRELAAPDLHNPTPLLPAADLEQGKTDHDWGVLVNTIAMGGS